MTIFNLPDLGEGLREAEVVTWHIKAGDVIAADEPLVSVETDKSIVDIPSPQSGRVEKLYAAVGDIVHTGNALVGFVDDEEYRDKDRGTVVGEVQVGKEKLEESATAVSRRTGVAVKATPSVRALARKLDVDLGIITPSGPGGAISADDVRRVADRLKELGPIELLRGVRRVMATKMIQSGSEVIPATVVDDADIEHWRQDTDVTIRLLQALSAGCKAEPALNAWFDSHAMGRRVLDKIDIAVAMDTKDGLFTPVLRDSGNRDETSLAAGMEKLKADVSNRTVPAQEMRGYTITLSNFGMIGGRYAAPVVLPPTVAILGAGRIEQRPVVVQDAVTAHRILPLSLTFDHRAVSGGEAARFLVAVIADLERT